jgi:hypothetical protein
MVNAAQDLAQRSIKACAEHYNFDGEEAVRLLGLVNVKLARARPVEVKPKKEKVVISKAAFPMPYNGEFNDACCYALRQNSGLYTQCQAVRKSKTTDGKNGDFCKQCQVLADKTEGVPEYGTIQMRQAVGIFEYTDPKGRKPVAYTKVMKKYKIDQEKVLEEAGKFNININAEHFVVAEVDSKRGRPKAEKAPKEAKGTKGRPKKAKKVLQIEGDDDDDLFASLVADANSNSGDEAVIAPKKTSEAKKKGKSEEEKEAERLQKEAEKAEKEAKRLHEKAEKEAKLAAEKLEKEAKKKAEEEARAAKKKAEEDEKAAKKLALEVAKAEKEAKLAAEKLAKESKTKKTAAAPKAANEPEVEEEPDVVKKIEFEGKKYLKSKKSGIIYDYNEYVKNGEQVMVGKWNESKNKIDFNNSGEESEEEYDM